MANDRATCFFFIKESKASDSEQEAIDAIEAVNIKVRNASLIGPSDRPEGNPEVDFVAGEIPEAYARANYRNVADKPARKANRKAALASDTGNAGAPAVATPAPALNPLPPALTAGFDPGAGPTPAGEPVPAPPGNVPPAALTQPGEPVLNPPAVAPGTAPEAPAPVTAPAPATAAAGREQMSGDATPATPAKAAGKAKSAEPWGVKP